MRRHINGRFAPLNLAVICAIMSCCIPKKKRLILEGKAFSKKNLQSRQPPDAGIGFLHP